jgi:hypothetical protein
VGKISKIICKIELLAKVKIVYLDFERENTEKMEVSINKALLIDNQSRLKTVFEEITYK